MARVGSNPAKSERIINPDPLITIIMPIYIPNLEGYFKDSFEILKTSIESIFLDKTPQIALTVILNGCCDVVVSYCYGLWKSNLIDNVIISNQNIGKVNAIMKGVSGSNSEIFLITDADVFFKQDFVLPLLKVFQNPDVGFVGLQPVYDKVNYFTSWTRLRWKSKIKMESAKSGDNLEHSQFLSSIGKTTFSTLKYIRALKIMSVECVLGTGHFCFAIHRSFLDKLPNLYCSNYISKGSERRYLDAPSYYTGLLRLSFRKSKALHLGNVLENWMCDMLEEKRNLCTNQPPKIHEVEIPKRSKKNVSKLFLRILEKIY